MVLTPPYLHHNQRLRCPRCTRAHSACICQWITPIAQPTELLILQHPLEVQHAKNSAGLLHWSLSNSRLEVGEAFEEAVLDDALLAPVQKHRQKQKYTVLLYPATDYADHAAPIPMDAAQLQNPSQVRLVVLDGTWRKSRKMLHLNPWLQSLPRFSLDDAVTSHYTIRKAHKPGQCSTLEATCAALAQLQGNTTVYAPLLQAFQGFVAQQARYAQAAAPRRLPTVP